MRNIIGQIYHIPGMLLANNMIKHYSTSYIFLIKKQKSDYNLTTFPGPGTPAPTMKLLIGNYLCVTSKTYRYMKLKKIIHSLTKELLLLMFELMKLIINFIKYILTL